MGADVWFGPPQSTNVFLPIHRMLARYKLKAIKFKMAYTHSVGSLIRFTAPSSIVFVMVP